jgi:hypothetical protein
MEWKPYDQAMEQLSYPNEKEMLTKAWTMIQAKMEKPKTPVEHN